MKRFSGALRFYIIGILALSVLMAGCAKQTEEPRAGADGAVATDAQIVDMQISEQPLDSGAAPGELPDAGTLRFEELAAYTEAPNANSAVSIQYPVFSGAGAETVNAMVTETANGLAAIDPGLFPPDAALTAEYQSAVTLINGRVVSVVFWGSSNIEGSAHPFTELVSLNIDLAQMKELTLADLYSTDQAFETVFFEKAFFPTDPVTSFDAAGFSEMLQYQSPEYQTVCPFDTPDSVVCFLKPDGVVFSLPAVHATGSDHFEAQLSYADVQPFYLPEQNYWEAP